MTRRDPNRHLLEEAGYVWDDRRDTWAHPKAARLLHGATARSWTEKQVRDWIESGDRRTKRK